MSDKLDVFMESQRETNQRLTDTMSSIADTVNRLEQEAVRYETVTNDVGRLETDLKHLEETVNAHSVAIEFVKGARKIFIAVLTAMILAGGGVWYQAVTTADDIETKKLLLEVVKQLKENS